MDYFFDECFYNDALLQYEEIEFIDYIGIGTNNVSYEDKMISVDNKMLSGYEAKPAEVSFNVVNDNQVEISIKYWDFNMGPRSLSFEQVEEGVLNCKISSYPDRMYMMAFGYNHTTAIWNGNLADIDKLIITH